MIALLAARTQGRRIFLLILPLGAMSIITTLTLCKHDTADLVLAVRRGHPCSRTQPFRAPKDLARLVLAPYKIFRMTAPRSPIPLEWEARVHELWDRLADFDATSTEEALLFVMRELKALADADDAVWIGVVRMAHGATAKRDHQLGWRGRVVVHLEWTDLKREVVAAAMKAQEIDGGVPSSIEMAKIAGSFRTLTLRELHDMKTFRRTEHYKSCFVPFGITDRMWCVFPVNEDCEVAYILDRFGDQPRFSEQDKQVVAATLRPLKWFHRETMLAHGVMLGDQRLTPRERSLCARLLGTQTEKEIAESLGLSFSTTRGYIQALYKKFGVQGRTGLMALWLGATR